MNESTPVESWQEREEERKRLEKEKEDSFYDLMRKVTDELSNISVKWEFEPRPGAWAPHANIKALDPKYGMLYVSLTKDKINISGHLPISIDGNDFITQAYRNLGMNFSSIGISSKKTPTKIAVEIDKRFLVDYVKIFREATKLKEEYIEIKNKDKSILESLCFWGNGKIHKQGPGADKVASLNVGDAYIDISVYYGSVRVERIGSLTPEQMQKIIQVLK